MLDLTQRHSRLSHGETAKDIGRERLRCMSTNIFERLEASFPLLFGFIT